MITYNAALNRPAYQSNVFNWTRTYPAHYANDGSRHTDYRTSPHCAVTDYEANPWWAVDLGHQMSIYRVYLTSSFYNFSREKTNVSGSDLLDFDVYMLNNTVHFSDVIMPFMVITALDWIAKTGTAA